MKEVSSERTELQQHTMWGWVGDVVFKSQAQLRPYVGDFYEEATRVLLNAARLKTDASRICPDLRLPSGEYVECKSVGRSNRTLLYEHRIVKYDDFMAAENSLYYVFWHHHHKATDSPTLNELRAALSKQTDFVVIVGGDVVHEAAKVGPSRFTSYSGTKQNPSQYKMKPARTLTAGQLKEWRTGKPQFAFMMPVYGVEMPHVSVYGGNPEWWR